MPVEFGVLIPTREAIMSGRPETGPLLTMAERAEAAGFDSVWIGDSITARPRHEPLTLMAAIAARTKRVRLGTGVLLPALRNPVVLAHLIATVDRISEGRVILGVGIAADTPAIRQEFAAVRGALGAPGGALPRDDRDLPRALDARRRHVQRQALHARRRHRGPRPHRPGGPPIWIGGGGPTAFREAARFDAWFPTGPSATFFAEHFPRIQAAARAAGRPADAVSGAAYVTLALDPDKAQAEQRLHQFLETYYAAPAARDAGPPGHLRGAHRGLRGLAPALDRRGRAASRAALRGRRSARAGGRGGGEAPAQAEGEVDPSPCPLPGGERDY